MQTTLVRPSTPPAAQAAIVAAPIAMTGWVGLERTFRYNDAALDEAERIVPVPPTAVRGEPFDV